MGEVFCTDCKHYEQTALSLKNMCWHPSLPKNQITGRRQWMSCEEMRKNRDVGILFGSGSTLAGEVDYCGPEGKLFEKRLSLLEELKNCFAKSKPKEPKNG